MFFGANGSKFRKATELRKTLTPAERILWGELRNRKLEGFKFRRQHPVSDYIVDFYCHEKRLVVEVDGKVHKRVEAHEYDADRTAELNALGLKVIRFDNVEVTSNLRHVLERILGALRQA